MPRNPDWTHEEAILALDCYVHELGRRPPRDDKEDAIERLSRRLRALTLHDDESRKPNFRSSTGVYSQIDRFAALDHEGHQGRDRGGSVYVKVWERYEDRPEALRTVAEAIEKAWQA